MKRSWIGSLSKLTLAVVVAVAMASAPLGCSQKKCPCGQHTKCVKDCDKCKDKAGCPCKDKANCTCKGKPGCACNDKANCTCKDKAGCPCADKAGCPKRAAQKAEG